jgi:hypothetical protein
MILTTDCSERLEAMQEFDGSSLEKAINLGHLKPYLASILQLLKAQDIRLHGVQRDTRQSSLFRDNLQFQHLDHLPHDPLIWPTMCHQVIKIFECGHTKPSKAVRCKKPTSKCGGIFLRQDLENTKGLCLVSGIDGLFISLLNKLSLVEERQD